MSSPEINQIASRRRFLQFMAASPLLADVSAPVFAQNMSAPSRPPDPMAWAPRDLDNLISDPQEALDVFDFEPVARKNLRFFADGAAKKWPLRGSLKRTAAFL